MSAHAQVTVDQFNELSGAVEAHEGVIQGITQDLTDHNVRIHGLETNKADVEAVAAIELVTKGLQAGIVEQENRIQEVDSRLSSAVEAHEGVIQGITQDLTDHNVRINSLETNKADVEAVAAIELVTKGLQAGINLNADAIANAVEAQDVVNQGLKAGIVEQDARIQEVDSRLSNAVEAHEGVIQGITQDLTDHNVRIHGLETNKADKADIADAKKAADDAKAFVTEAKVVVEGAKVQTTNAENAANAANAAATSAREAVAGFDNRFGALEGRVGGLEGRVDGLEQRISTLDDDYKKGMAVNSALTGLFQPYSVGKFNTSVALGGYDSKTAVAAGIGYRANENLAFKGGLATSFGSGSNKVGYNVGMNYEW